MHPSISSSTVRHFIVSQPRYSLLFFCTMLLILLGGCQPFSAQQRVVVPPEGWAKVTSEQVSIWFPPDYKSYSTEAEIDQLIADLRAGGPKNGEKADALVQNGLYTVLVAYEKEWQGEGCPPTVLVRHTDTALAPVELNEQIVQQISDSVGSVQGVQVREHGMMTLERFGAGRIVFENAQSCQTGVAYVVPWGKNYWIITFLAPTADFEHYLPIFEQSIRTFEVLPPEETK